jgi:hypothetical protein
VETDEDTWFFVCNYDVNSPDEARFRELIAREALREVGALP